MNETNPNQDINYLQGQIHGLQALLLGMAGLVLSREQFRDQGLARLSAARDQVMCQPVQEKTLDGIDSIETWLKKVTNL